MCCQHVDTCVCVLSLAGGDVLRRRRRSLASSSTGRLLSLAEAQERERIQTSSGVSYFEVGGGPSALPSKYHTVIDFPKRSVVSCSAVVLMMWTLQ